MTPRTTERHVIEGPAGALEIVMNVPEGPRGIALIAHPHPQQGGSLDNKVVQTLAKTFFALDYVAVRFNFRGVGESVGAFDEGLGETEDALAALRFAQSSYPLAGRPVLAGFSFGSFIQTRVAQRVEAERLVLIGPAVKRFPLERVPADTVVIHGEQDDVVLLSDVLDWARPQHLPIIVFPGTGHFFHGRLVQLQQLLTSLWAH